MIEQVMIAFTGAVAIYLTQQEKRLHLKKYACIFGLVGQPFWFYSAYTAEQYGVLALTTFYTYAWLIGFKNYWLKKGK